MRWCLPSIRLDQTGAPSIRLSCRHHQHLARTTDPGGQHSSPALSTHRGQGRSDIYLDTDIYGDDFVNNQLYSKSSIEAAIDRINDCQYAVNKSFCINKTSNHKFLLTRIERKFFVSSSDVTKPILF